MNPPAASAPDPTTQIVTTARIDDERVIGSVSIVDPSGIAAMWIPKRETLLGGTRLSVPAPKGAELDDAALRQRAAAELAGITGAEWPEHAGGAVHLFDHLLDAQTRADYAARGLRIQYDPPDTRYYAISTTIDGLHVEVTGAVGEWGAVFVAQPLTPAEALDGALPRSRPADALALVRRIAPAFAAHPWQPDSPPPPVNIFDVSLHAPGVHLRAGVRARGPADATTYFYGVRVNWERVAA